MKLSHAIRLLLALLIVGGWFAFLWWMVSQSPTPRPPPSGDQIRIGMSEDEVLSALGEPDFRGPTGEFEGIEFPRSPWKIIEYRLLVLLAYGFDGLCTGGDFGCHWWEYHGRPTGTT